MFVRKLRILHFWWQRFGVAPDWGKWAGRPWAQELANVMKKKCNILVRIWRVPRISKMGQEALDLRIGKCHTENV